MKTLVIPDVHMRLDKLRPIEDMAHGMDEVVCLGDWFDSHEKKQSSVEEVCAKLFELMEKPNWTFLFGNHDAHYFWECDGITGSGWNHNTQRVIKDFRLHVAAKQRWEWFKFVEGALLSHAGINPRMMHPVKGVDGDYLRWLSCEAEDQLEAGLATSFVACGRGRGGAANVGGIIWQDWEKEFVPLHDVVQVVGHSYEMVPRVKKSLGTPSFCIDTGLKFVATIVSGAVEVEEV